MYHNILVPLDGSGRAEKILPHVEKLAVQNGSTVSFLCVVRFPVISDGYATISVDQSIEENKRLLHDTLAYLKKVEDEFKKKGINAKSIVENGDVVETIIRVARRENVDLIAMASHGRGGLSRVFYGSVAIGVLHAVDRPLLLVRSRKE